MKTDDPLRKFAFAGASLQLVPPTTIITRFNKLAFTKHEVKSLAQEKSE